MRYNVAIAYLLWLCSGCGALGFHRFYLGKVGTGIVWMLSGGLFGIGCLYDAVTLYQQKVWDTGVLAAGVHTVTIEWSGTKNESATGTNINVDAVDVSGTLR